MKKFIAVPFLLVAGAALASDDPFADHLLVATTPKTSNVKIFLSRELADGLPCPKGRLAVRLLSSTTHDLGCWWDMGESIEFTWLRVEGPHMDVSLPRSTFVWRKPVSE